MRDPNREKCVSVETLEARRLMDAEEPWFYASADTEWISEGQVPGFYIWLNQYQYLPDPITVNYSISGTSNG